MEIRRPWRRTSRPRLSLVVAATSALTLAASSPVYSAVSGGRVFGHTSVSSVAAAGSTAAKADCSKTAANEVVMRLHLNDPSVTDPVFKVLCGAFAGTGSETMVASLFGPGNTGMIDWAVFRWAGDTWQFLMKRHQAAVLTAAESDIREKVSVYNEGDSRCCPRGGTKARIWHWNGTRFTASFWTWVSGTAATFAEFFSPNRNVGCDMGDHSGLPAFVVFCRSESRELSVTLSPNGRLYICRGTRPDHPCIGHPAKSSPTLAYGNQMTVGRFRCRSQRSGVRCTVIRSGKGFLISSNRVIRVG